MLRRSIFGKHLSKIIAAARHANRPDVDARRFEDKLFANNEAALSRRKLLGAAAGVGAVMAMPACASSESDADGGSGSGAALKTDKKIVIVGAGAAGLTAAYRLMQAGWSSTVYEGEPKRLGGRMWTQQNFNGDKQFVERGAELVDTLNESLIPLAKELGLEIEEFAPGDEGFEAEFFYFGGTRYTSEQLYAGLRPFLKSVEQDINAARLNELDSVTYQTKANDALKKLDNTSLAQYFGSKATTTDSWVLRALEVAYMTEYGDDVATQLALNFLTLADTDLSDGFTWYGQSDESKRVKGGNSQITSRLADKLKAANVPINTDHTLVAIRENSEGIRLTFKKSNGGTVEVVADQVIMALPFTTLRLVEGIKDLSMPELKKRSIAKLGYGKNVKHMAGFKSRGWRDGIGGVPKSTGVLTTDLGMGMVWETSRLQAGKSGILTNFLGGTDALTARPDSNLKRMLADLNTFWPGLAALHDGNHVMQHWPNSRFARGSYVSPEVGQYTTLFGSEGDTELNGRLIFAGEHTSPDWWGFMNGAIQSGERAAKEVLGENVSQVKPAARTWKVRPT